MSIEESSLGPSRSRDESFVARMVPATLFRASAERRLEAPAASTNYTQHYMFYT